MSVKLSCHPRLWHGSLTATPRYKKSLTKQPAWQVRFSHVHGIKVAELKRIKTQYFCGTWYIPNPKDTDPSHVIPLLPKIEDANARKVLNKAVFLASPGLAPWFASSDTFLKDAINWMYSPPISERPPLSYAAIVDALPSAGYFSRKREAEGRRPPTSEGIAVCLMSDLVAREKGAAEVDEGPATLTVASSQGGFHDGKYELANSGVFRASLTIALANTLFVNGRRSTAFKTVWGVDGDGQMLVPKYDMTPLKAIQFGLPRMPGRLFDHSVPLQALTVRRTVLASMGNVVSQVEGDDGKPLRASAELEDVVPKYLAQQKAGEDVQIQVFARVMPVGVSHHEKDEIAPPKSSRFTHYRKTYGALWGKGSTYRVVSGGGGWGKKAGLLSLDPTTNFEPLVSSEQTMFPDPDIVETQEDPSTKIGALVPAGYTIQFFATKLPQPSSSSATVNTSNTPGRTYDISLPLEAWQQKKDSYFLFGNTVATDAPLTEASKVDPISTAVSFIPGCFGALSEGGTSLAVSRRTQEDGDKPASHGKDASWELINEFKVDVPSAVFRTQINENTAAEKADHDKPVASTAKSADQQAVLKGSQKSKGETIKIRKTVTEGAPHWTPTVKEPDKVAQPKGSRSLNDVPHIRYI